MTYKYFRNLLFLLSCITLCFATPLQSQEYFGGNHLCEPLYAEWGRFSVGADWLFWKASEDGLDFASFKNASPSLAAPVSSSSGILRPDSLWESGYKVYLGYEIPCYYWEFGIIYTHAPFSFAKTSLSMNNPLPPPAIPLSTILTQDIHLIPTFLYTNSILGGIPTEVIASSIIGEWKLHFDYVDFDLGHTMCFTDYLSITPHIGLRYLWSDQRFQIAYRGAIPGTPQEFDYIPKMKEKLWGTGIEGGLWGNWQVGGFSIIGHIGGAVLYGNCKLNNSLLVITTANSIVEKKLVRTPVTTETNAFSDRIYTAIPMLDYFIGAQYGICICDMEYIFNIGWESHVVFNANRFTLSDTGNLYLQGLTLGVGLNF